MLILMNLNTPRKDIDAVKNKIMSLNCTPHEIPGKSKLAVGITGPTDQLNKKEFLLMPSVEEIIRVTKKYKLVSRMMQNDDTIIDFDGFKFGGDSIQIIAGPCSVESKDQIFDIAGSLQECGIKFMRAGAFKPRSSPYSFQGLKEKGLEYLQEVKKEFGLVIVTELLNIVNMPVILEAADIIQIGARNMLNYALLEVIGKVNKPILLKRGMAATIEELLLSAEYILSNGNKNVILCERGIRTFETATRNTLDLNAVPLIKKESHLPIIVDPSHGIGMWDKVPAMSLGAIACGADGLIIEVHNHPDEALSDGFQSITPKALKELLEKIKQLAPIVNKRLVLNE
ncbi:MAG: 3-deoxy-7-phosphoheptulonate synthase [Ignavibacteria bacterium]